MFEQLLIHLKNTCPVTITFENDSFSYGYFDPIKDYININIEHIKQFNKSPEYVLFHELAHMTGVGSRLGRVPVMKSEIDMSLVNQIEYKNEESIADLIAIRLLSYFGLITGEIIKDHTEYINLLKTDTQLNDFVNDGTNFILNNWLKDFKFNNETKAA